MQDNMGGFKYNIIIANNTIQLLAIQDINYASILPEYYTTLKDFYQRTIEKQNEKIVLVKAVSTN